VVENSNERRSFLNSNQQYHKTRNGTPVVRTISIGFILMTFLALVPAISSAADIAGTSNTYLQYRETVDGSNLLPLYEYLDLNVQNLGNEAVSVHFGGWLRYDLLDDSFGKEKNSDLQYGYVSYRRKTGNMVVNAGRVMVFEGIAAERVDGVYARTDLQRGFGISVFGGAPVETNINLPGNNMIYGGRVSHQNPGLYVIGLSYLKEDKNSDTFRREGGLDLWVRPMNKLELSGRSSFNFQTPGWMENAYYLMLGPYDKLRINVEATWISYAEYFAAATTSALKLTPGGTLDSNEKVNILGPEVFYTINNNWSVSVDYKSYGYDIAGSASYYGVKANYAMPKSYSAGISLHTMDGDSSRLQYDEYRIYAAKKMQKVDIAIDLLDVKYKESINGVSNAYSLALAAGYALSEKLRLGADLEYSKNPDFDSDVRLFAKVLYSFDVAKGTRAAAPAKAAPAAEPAAAPAPSTEPVTPAPAAEPAAAPQPEEPGKAKEGNP
jgi:hypothetical protein